MNYEARRQQALKLTQDNAFIAVSAASEMQLSADSPYPYRQDSNFRYLCGYEHPDATLVFNAEESILFVREPDEHVRLWDRSELDIDKLETEAMVDEVKSLSELDAWLKQHKSQHFYVPKTEQSPHSQMQLNSAQQQLIELIQSCGMDNVQDASTVLAKLRRVKDEQELALLDQAVRITQDALEQLDTNVDYEYQLEAQLSAYLRNHNSNHAYQPIVASGSNATILHYRDNDAKLPKNGMVLIDIGAEVSGYGADVTRMIDLGQPSQLQQQLLYTVSDLQQRAIERIKPGVTVRELAQSFRKDLLEWAKQAELLPNDAEPQDTIKLMPHGVHHYLGLDVHDVGDYKQPLEPGVVLMVEPGLYQFDKDVGVRIEDGVVVTKDGCRMLGNSIQ